MITTNEVKENETALKNAYEIFKNTYKEEVADFYEIEDFTENKKNVLYEIYTDDSYNNLYDTDREYSFDRMSAKRIEEVRIEQIFTEDLDLVQLNTYKEVENGVYVFDKELSSFSREEMQSTYKTFENFKRKTKKVK
jgi:biotin carboxylase